MHKKNLIPSRYLQVTRAQYFQLGIPVSCVVGVVVAVSVAAVVVVVLVAYNVCKLLQLRM